jgi:NAD(P)-dependent dehydrogenase (short-subunit alcohol dehydrogenase family)
MQDLTGKVAVVTGGGSGIGRGIALGLADEQMTVAIADIHAESAEGVVAEIADKGGRAFAVPVDVTSVESLAGAAKQVEAEVGGVNLLCANAGVLARIASLDDHTIEDWEYTLSVNVMGVVKTVKAFLPLLRECAPDAHIVNTASLGGLIATEGFPIGAYIASKYACVGYSEMLRAELAREGIGVSVLCPGVVASELVRTSMRNRPDGFGDQDMPAYAGGGTLRDNAPESISPMPAEDVGPIIVDAVRENRLHVLTHPESRPIVEKRFSGVLADYEHAASRKAADKAR